MSEVFELMCALCGCPESEHGGEIIDENGDVTEVCTGCGQECEFEPEEDA